MPCRASTPTRSQYAEQQTPQPGLVHESRRRNTEDASETARARAAVHARSVDFNRPLMAYVTRRAHMTVMSTAALVPDDGFVDPHEPQHAMAGGPCVPVMPLKPARAPAHGPCEHEFQFSPSNVNESPFTVVGIRWFLGQRVDDGRGGGDATTALSPSSSTSFIATLPMPTSPASSSLDTTPIA